METPVVDDVVLGGRYRLGSPLGAGGMAQVFDGWDERLARPVAVKLLRPDLAALPDLRRRFELEARAAARLTHPNVVAVYDAGEEGRRSYIVMERLGGESLADSIGRGPLDVAWLRRLAEEILAALAAAHAAGIVHRDIKPANILLGPDGRAKVADFGIASVIESAAATEHTAGRAATALTGAGLVLGTPAYLAPERAMGMPATPQSDLYSVAVVLYEALTGRKPFAGATPVAVAAAAATGAAADPRQLRPDADPQLVAVIARAMAPDPAHRYATAAEMAADLRQAPQLPGTTSIMPVATSPPGAGAGAVPGAVPRMSAVRRWGWVAVGVAVVAALGAVLVGLSAGSGKRISTSASTTVPPVTVPTTAPTASTAPPTTPTNTVANPNDPLASSLRAIAAHLARSRSAAAGQVAVALMSLAATADPAARASAASSLLDRVVQWYRQGQLSTADYVIATGVLRAVGAPPAPPPTVKGHGDAGGGGGAGG